MAEAAKVITQRVSRVLNQVSYFLGETRRRMQLVVVQLSDPPRTLAHRFTQQCSFTLGNSHIRFEIYQSINYAGPRPEINRFSPSSSTCPALVVREDSKRV